MAADLESLRKLQARRMARAQETLARAQGAKLAADHAVEAALARFSEQESGHASQRDARIRAILKAPPSVVSLAQVRLQYDVGEDELAALMAEIQACKRAQQMAQSAVQTAQAALQVELKRDKKLENADARHQLHKNRLHDVQAEMELER